MDATLTQDQTLARDMVEAVKNYNETANEEWMTDCENTILDRLDVSLDETEQGLTKYAVDQIEAFVSENIGRKWTYAE